jgi:hypothetical protein
MRQYFRGAFQIFASHSGRVGEDTGHGGPPWLLSSPASDNLKCTHFPQLPGTSLAVEGF